MQIIDVILTRFICRREPLPCNEKDNYCITYKNFDKVRAVTVMKEVPFQFVNAAVQRNERLLKNKTSVLRRSSAADALAVLQQLKGVIEGLNKDPKTSVVRVK